MEKPKKNTNVIPTEKKVQRFARCGFGIYLTKELKEIGNPDTVYVSVMDGKIIISKECNIDEIIRPLDIDKNLWNNFLFVISHIYKTKSFDTIKKVLEEIIQRWIEDQREEIWTIFGFIPIYKKKRF